MQMGGLQKTFSNGAKHWGTTDWGWLEEVPRIVLREIEKDPGYHKIPRVLYVFCAVFGDYCTVFAGTVTTSVEKLTSTRPWRRLLPVSSSVPQPRPWKRLPSQPWERSPRKPWPRPGPDR